MKSPGFKLKMITGGTIVLLMIAMAILAPILTQFDPQSMALEERYTSPNGTHFFGQDENGSDVFSKVVYGARVSLTVSLVVVFLSALIGLIVGSLAGYLKGTVDLVITWIVDMFYAFPGFLLALSLVAVLGPSLRNIILAMVLNSWTGFARLVRGEVLHLKEKEFVQSARAAGARSAYIVVKHIWPNLLGVLVVQMTLAMAGAIVTESGLSFLGLGVPPTTPSWGALLNSGRHFLMEAPHISIFPGLAIVTLVFGFNLLGDGLREKIVKG